MVVAAEAGVPGGLQQDGGDGATVDGAAVDAQQHQDAADALEGEGEREEQGDAHVDGQTGQRADDDTHRHAGK